MRKKRMLLGAATAVLVLLSLSVLAAACGDDDSDADPTATTAPAGDPAATEPADVEPTDSAEPDPTASEAAAAETSLDVSLTEFVVGASVESVPAGTVTFNVTSDGGIFHNFKVVATDLAPDALPTDDATFAVDEDQVDVVASTADLDPGEAEELTLELEAGNYVLICNIPTHYGAGMAVAFTVE